MTARQNASRSGPMDAAVVSEASNAAPAPTGGSKQNDYTVSALAAAATFAAPSSTPVAPADGNRLLIAIKDNGTARALTWNAAYVVVGTTLPTTTVAGKWHYIGARYNAAASAWHVTAVTVQA